MFGNDKKSNGGKPESLSANLNTIAKGTVIRGEIESQGIIRIDGAVHGTVRTAAKIAVGRSGSIEGDMFCAEADIEGRIQGTLKVEDKLTIRSKGTVTGDIHTGKLVVEPGAEFNGNCRMGASAAQPMPSKASGEGMAQAPLHGSNASGQQGPSLQKKAG
jgi:cytoskeletal protein CcmA (bactofilin family)